MCIRRSKNVYTAGLIEGRGEFPVWAPRDDTDA